MCLVASAAFGCETRSEPEVLEPSLDVAGPGPEPSPDASDAALAGWHHNQMLQMAKKRIRLVTQPPFGGPITRDSAQRLAFSAVNDYANNQDWEGLSWDD